MVCLLDVQKPKDLQRLQYTGWIVKTLFSIITLLFLVSILNNFCTTRKANEYSTYGLPNLTYPHYVVKLRTTRVQPIQPTDSYIKMLVRNLYRKSSDVRLSQYLLENTVIQSSGRKIIYVSIAFFRTNFIIEIQLI